jgi:hypothetical protein
MDISVVITGSLTEIRTEYISNTRQDRYRYATLLGKMVIVKPKLIVMWKGLQVYMQVNLIFTSECGSLTFR